MFANGPFLYSQAAHADLSGSVWDATAEGTQNFHGDEDFNFTYGQITPRGQDHNETLDEIASKWIATESAAPAAEPMRRVSSRASSGSHKNKTIKASAHKSRPQMHSAVSQGPSVPDFGMAGNSQVDGYLLQDSDARSVPSPLYYPALPMGMQLNFDASLSGNSPPGSWGSLSPGESRISSPGIQEDAWSLAPVPMDTSPTHTNNSSPVMDGTSPRYVPTMMPTPAIFLSDPNEQCRLACQAGMNAHGLVLADDMFALPPSFARRPSGDHESTARDHPLYKTAFPQADGLFHCPWEGTSNCNHKPEKLKCNYDKFVDSHLKPYRCKNESCENARFSSTACLLRHEREAHAMHGHGDKPYLCTYEGCDRALPGNGFPRQWNLKDHMRRVHNDNGSSLPTSSPSALGSSQVTAKGRKRKSKDAVDSIRKHTSRSVQAAEAAAAAARAAEKPMIEEWYSHQKALQAYLQEFNAPDAFDYANDVAGARDHMEAMGRISKKLKTHRHSYGHHG
ncbi:hypothetical protein F4780DRAFT_489269 [Xylariomycetidae sp. FL0641]|nr:hypothetical protein F4780DRAFT_489269 [Xylariomycetidae sp. FL0641]